MKAATILEVLPIVLGIVGFMLVGFSLVRKKQVVDTGPIKSGDEKNRTISIPPTLSGIAMIGGIGLVVAGIRRK